MELTGTVALVTGAARRIGAEIAAQLAAGGARVAIHCNTSRHDAEKLAGRLRDAGGEADVFRGDVTCAADVRRVVAEVAERFGPPRILVNNAAVFDPTPFDGLDEAAWDRQIDVNLKGSFLFAREAGRRMREAGGPGKIVNFACVSGLTPWKDYIAYSVSKAGVIALTKALAKALAPDIQVNAVAPGPILRAESETEQRYDALVARLPLQRPGAPSEIADAVRFFIANDFVTGQILPVDGGRSLL